MLSDTLDTPLFSGNGIGDCQIELTKYLNNTNGFSYSWQVTICYRSYLIAKGHARSEADAMAQSSQAILNFWILPEERRIYQPLANTVKEENLCVCCNNPVCDCNIVNVRTSKPTVLLCVTHDKVIEGRENG